MAKRLLLVFVLVIMLLLAVAAPALAGPMDQSTRLPKSTIAVSEYYGWSGWDFLVLGDLRRIDGSRNTIAFGQINDNVSGNYLQFWVNKLHRFKVSLSGADMCLPVHVEGTLDWGKTTVCGTATLTATFKGVGDIFEGPSSWSFFYPETGPWDPSSATFVALLYRNASVSWSLIGNPGSSIDYEYSTDKYPDDMRTILASGLYLRSPGNWQY